MNLLPYQHNIFSSIQCFR